MAKGVNFEDKINIPIEETLSRINKTDNRLTPDKAITSLGNAYFSGVFQDESGTKDLFTIKMYGYNNIPVDKYLRNFIGIVATKIDYSIKDSEYIIFLNHNGEYEEAYQTDESLSEAIKFMKM